MFRKVTFQISSRFQHITKISTSVKLLTEEQTSSQAVLTDFFKDEEKPKPKVNPEEKYVILFPGQGSQYVGMIDDLLQYPEVEPMFEAASEIFQYNLKKLCLNGPKSILDKTMYCQPAVVLTALAAMEKLNSKYADVLENCVVAAGYSVGEYAALIFSGALSFEDGMQLVKIRAKEMQSASDNVGSGMITVIGSKFSKYKHMCKVTREYCEKMFSIEDPICDISAYLSPNVLTIAGHRVALEFIMQNKKQFNLKRVTMLPVSGAFHTQLMHPACTALQDAIKSVEINKPLLKVYSNIDGKAYGGEKDIKQKLPKQIIKPVYWEQTMHGIFSRERGVGMINVIETGPGEQLGSILKLCNGKAWQNYVNVNNL